MNTIELVKNAKKGDDKAFYALVSANKEQLYRIAYSYLKNEQDTLESLQEVTYLAYKNIKKLKYPEYFNTWLIRILINYCHDELKRSKRVIVHPSNKEDETRDSYMKLELEEEIRKLRSNYQDVIILRYFQDFSVTEISRILDKPEGTIKTWIHMALKQLRIQMKEGECIE